MFYLNVHTNEKIMDNKLSRYVNKYKNKHVLFANFTSIYSVFAYMIKCSKFAHQEDESLPLLIPKFHDAIFFCCANITPLLSVRYLHPPFTEQGVVKRFTDDGLSCIFLHIIHGVY